MSDAAYLRREWLAEAPFHLAVTLLVALGFVMWASLGGWVRQVGAGSAEGAPELALPAGAAAMVVEPAWLLLAFQPDFDLGAPAATLGGRAPSPPPAGQATPAGGGAPAMGQLTRGQLWAMAQGYGRTLAFLRESLPTEAGTVWVWGLPPEADRDLASGLRFLAGGWPVGPGEVALPRSLAEGLGKSVGDTFWIGCARWPFGLWGEETARVSGIFEADSPLLEAVVADEAWLADLTGLPGENALLAWPGPGPAGRSPASLPAPGAGPPLPRTREPLVPAWLLRGLNPGDPHDPRDEVGVPTPFALSLGATVLTRDTLAEEIREVAGGSRLRSAPLLLLVLALLFAALTVLSVVRTLDRQRALGILKAVGCAARDVRRQAQVAAVVDACAGTLAGALAFELLAQGLAVLPGGRLSLPWGAAAEWALALAVLVWWQGAVVSILYHQTDARALLARSGRFDWWSLLRFDLTKPAE